MSTDTRGEPAPLFSDENQAWLKPVKRRRKEESEVEKRTLVGGSDGEMSEETAG